MNISRPTRLAVVPALFAALALSACQDEAPTAAPPSPVSPTATPATSQPSSSATPQAPSPTSESTAAPTASGPAQPSSAAPGGGCRSTDLFQIRRGDVAPKPLTEPQTARKSMASLEVTIGAPTVDTSSGTSYFPGDGFQTVIFPVSMKATTGTYVISELHFGLTDPADQPCKKDIGNAVVPGGDEINVKALQQGDQYSGKVGFAIPAGADLSKYTVVYSSEYSAGRAQIAWSAR